MKKYRADLHVHTVLSPCAEIEMLPPLIVNEVLNRGIDLIAITDHNASSNIESVQKAAKDTGITVLPGIELQTKEEVHLLCLFDELFQVEELQEIVNSGLPSLRNRADYFGDQLIVDENGDFVSKEDRLLITSVNLSLEEAFLAVEKIGGLCIPAHVNRKANGLLEILGFVPENVPFLALEVSRHISPKDAKLKYPQLDKFQIIQNGDVHRLSEFVGTTIFNIESPRINEIRLALSNDLGRSYLVQAG